MLYSRKGRVNDKVVMLCFPAAAVCMAEITSRLDTQSKSDTTRECVVRWIYHSLLPRLLHTTPWQDVTIQGQPSSRPKVLDLLCKSRSLSNVCLEFRAFIPGRVRHGSHLTCRHCTRRPCHRWHRPCS